MFAAKASEVRIVVRVRRLVAMRLELLGHTVVLFFFGGLALSVAQLLRLVTLLTLRFRDTCMSLLSAMT